tara:strand:+ start:816 stop:1829 length:1014 start_codon:yes stop_codon:yes gene_type:complete
MKVLLTGCAGFIGFHLAKKYLDNNIKVLGVDNLNDYYSIKLKKDRLKELYRHKKSKNFMFKKISIENYDSLKKIFLEFKPSIVVNLAAQAGVRHSLKKPLDYVKSNLVGFANILILSKEFYVKHFVYASTSSVYGVSKKKILLEKDAVDHPIQFYAATKRSNELMAHSYSSLFNLPTTGLRFFTVYGPWGRPDMALFSFTKNILKKKPIHIFNYGKHYRDFTYIDDIVDGTFKVSTRKYFNKKKIKDPSESNCPFRVMNIGNNRPVKLMKYVELLENELAMKSKKIYKSLQKGDVPKTNASIKKIKKIYKYKPKTTIEEGIKNFVNWYKKYYNLKQS